VAERTSRSLAASAVSTLSAQSCITPTASAEELHRQLPGVALAFFEMITSEPLCGAGLVSPRGKILYMNDQSARHIAGEDARASEMVGRSLGEFFPPVMMEQRLEVFRRVQEGGRPVLVRTLWNGRQLTTWFRRVEMRPDRVGPTLVFALSRYLAGDLRSLFPPEAVELIETSVVRLGPLDCLSPQELRVMALVGAGLSVREAAHALFRAEKTIESHCTAIRHKLGLHDRVEVVRVAQRAGLTLQDAERPRV
jgi:DNA-binding CsgD family transcriptional regulator